jgi:fatty-acyl-CoA synthase
VRILHGWGMTETPSLGAVAHPSAWASEDESWPYRVSQGLFPPLVEHRLVGDDGKVLPQDGEALGEFEVRGPWITGSYYAPTGEAAGSDAFDDGWLRTGDVGRISPDGYLTLADRAKDVIKSGGEWISSVGLENGVMSHPDVAGAAVFGVPDEKWDERPCVAVVLREGATADVEALRAHLAGSCAKWQLPERWTFIAEVPKPSVGKFDKRRCASSTPRASSTSSQPAELQRIRTTTSPVAERTSATGDGRFSRSYMRPMCR